MMIEAASGRFAPVQRTDSAISCLPSRFRPSAGTAPTGRAGRSNPPVRAAGREHPRPRRLHGSGAARQPGLLDPLYISPQIEELLGYPYAAWLNEDELWLDVLHPGRPRAHGGGRRERAPHTVVALRRVPDGAPGRSRRLGQREGGRRQGRDRRRAVLAGRDGRHHRAQARRSRRWRPASGSFARSSTPPRSAS